MARFVRWVILAACVRLGCHGESDTDTDVDTDVQPVPLPQLADAAFALEPVGSDNALFGVVGNAIYLVGCWFYVCTSTRWIGPEVDYLEGLGLDGDAYPYAVSPSTFVASDGYYSLVVLHRFEPPGVPGPPVATIDERLTPRPTWAEGLVGTGEDEIVVFIGTEPMRNGMSGWRTNGEGDLGGPDVELSGTVWGGVREVTGDGSRDLLVMTESDESRVLVYAAPLPLGTLSEASATATVSLGDAGLVNVTDGEDVTGDGVVDLIVSVREEDASVRVIPGPIAGELSLSDATVQVHGPASEAWGWAVAPVGDIDGDGRSDLVFGAPGPRSGEDIPGRVCVYRTGDWPGVSSVSASELPCRWGQVPGERAGISLAVLDDLDGDGLHDVAAISGGRPASGTPEDDAPPEDPAIPAWVYWLSGADLATWEAP